MASFGECICSCRSHLPIKINFCLTNRRRCGMLKASGIFFFFHELRPLKSIVGSNMLQLSLSNEIPKYCHANLVGEIGRRWKIRLVDFVLLFHHMLGRKTRRMSAKFGRRSTCVWTQDDECRFIDWFLRIIYIYIYHTGEFEFKTY